MAAKLGEAFVDITGNNSPLIKSLSASKAAVNKATQAMADRMRKTGEKMKAVGAGFTKYVTLPIVGGLALATRAAIIQEDAEFALAAALKNTNDFTKASFEDMKKYASSLQEITIYGDEAIITQMAVAKNMGVSADKLKETTKAAIGLGAAYTLDLKTAMMLMARASAGQTTMLTKYGIILDASLSPQEKFNELLKIGAKNFKLAEAAAETTGGKIKQALNAIGDAALESIGKVLTPTIKAAANTLKKWAVTFSGYSDGVKSVIVTVALLAAALGPLLLVLGKLMTTMALIKISGITFGASLTKLGVSALYAAPALIAVAAAIYLMSIRAANAEAANAKLVTQFSHFKEVADSFEKPSDKLKVLKEQLRTLVFQMQVVAEQGKTNPLQVWWAGGPEKLKALRAEADKIKAQIIGVGKAEKISTKEKEKQLNLQRQMSSVRSVFTRIAEQAAAGKIKFSMNNQVENIKKAKITDKQAKDVDVKNEIVRGNNISKEMLELQRERLGRMA